MLAKVEADGYDSDIVAWLRALIPDTPPLVVGARLGRTADGDATRRKRRRVRYAIDGKPLQLRDLVGLAYFERGDAAERPAAERPRHARALHGD